MVKSNILYDYAYLLNPLLDSIQKVELDRQIDATKLAPGLNYLVFRRNKIWTKAFCNCFRKIVQLEPGLMYSFFLETLILSSGLFVLLLEI